MDNNPTIIQINDGWTGYIYHEWSFPEEVIRRWESISAQYGDKGIFINYGWFDCWWNAFGNGEKPFIVVLQKDGETKAVIPLYTDGDHLKSMTNSHTCHYDFIVDPEMRSDAISHFIHILRQGARGKRVSFEYLEESGKNIQSFMRKLQQSITPFHPYTHSWSPWMLIPLDWDSYFESLTGRLKNSIRRCNKKAESRGPLEMEIVQKSECLDDVLDLFFDLEFKNWKGRAGTAIRCEPETERFYKILGHYAMHEGSLFLVILRWNNSPIAASLCLKSGKTVFLLKPGYDEEFSEISPGNILQFKCLKSLSEKREVSFYNFLGACDPWKMEWTSNSSRYGYIKVYPKSLGGWVAYSFKYGLKNLLKRSSMIRHAKNWLDCRKDVRVAC
jgi:hypothetical protein